jgi:uncharacterized BrkB/YihY/UPF0761 family membrane protein
MQEGIILGIITAAGFWAIYRKLPRIIQRIISYPKTAWITDLLFTIGSYLLLSGISSSFASALGCGVAGVLISIYLWIQGGSNGGKNS